jgi:hypothetical protein
MTKNPATFYRYRAFDVKVLDSLCHDTLYFAHSATFNDPMDCRPTLACDSDLRSLRSLLTVLIRRRVSRQMELSLRAAKIAGSRSDAHIQKRANTEVDRRLADISYHATNPDYEDGPLSAEKWLLTHEIESELLQHYERGVCCFSTTYSSPLLWSHYGDQHKGLCVGYGTARRPVPRLQRVLYGGQRSIKTSVLVRALIEKEKNALRDIDRGVLLRKAKDWSYEREYRLIGFHGLQDSPLLLKEVTFGLRCPPSVKHAVVKALADRRAVIQFHEIYETRSRYSLRRRDLDTDELAHNLPKTAESGEEMFGSKVAQKSPKRRA